MIPSVRQIDGKSISGDAASISEWRVWKRGMVAYLERNKYPGM